MVDGFASRTSSIQFPQEEQFCVVLVTPNSLKTFYGSRSVPLFCRYRFSKFLLTNQPNEILDEFIEVTCRDVKTYATIYSDYFAFLPLKEETEKRCDNADSSKLTKEPSLNTLVIGLDTLSRLQFHRHFPRSSTFLKERLDAIEMMGYNKVAENTYPNLVPLLTGLSAKQLRNRCLKDNDGLVDSCPLIWKKYHQEGFRYEYFNHIHAETTEA